MVRRALLIGYFPIHLLTPVCVSHLGRTTQKGLSTRVWDVFFSRFEASERARLAATAELDAMRSMFGGDFLDAAAVEGMFGLKWEKQGPGVHLFRHAGGFCFELSSGGEPSSNPSSVEGSPATPSKATEVVYRPLEIGNQHGVLPARLVDVESVTFETRLLPKFFSQLLSALHQ